MAVGAVVRDGIRDETYFAYVVTGDEKIVGFEVVNKDGAPALKYSEEIMGEDDPDVLANPTSIVLSTDGAYAYVGLGMKGRPRLRPHRHRRSRRWDALSRRLGPWLH